MKDLMAHLSEHLQRRSVSAVAALEGSFAKILMIWMGIVSFMCGLRIAFAVSPIDSLARLIETILPYILVTGAPVFAFFIANSLFPRGILMKQPEIRLSRYGRWQDVNCLSARQHAKFGPTGMMASLLIGMLLNVPLRSGEFLMAVPAMNSNAPLWGQMILVTMTFDVVVMNFLYVFAFVMALRNVPWFPRLLLLVWGIDICSQLAIAQLVGGMSNLPTEVGAAMGSLLEGNIKKVMISATLWLPYLILSERVNLTYRSRLAAAV
jgi:hypothetical protein